MEKTTWYSVGLQDSTEQSHRYTIKVLLKGIQTVDDLPAEQIHQATASASCGSTSNSFTVTTPNGSNLQTFKIQRPVNILSLFTISTLTASQTNACAPKTLRLVTQDANE